MNLHHEHQLLLTRRQFFGRTATGIGAVALASLLNPSLFAGQAPGSARECIGVMNTLQFAPKAKRVIYLFMSGGPSHIDLFDYKPALRKLNGTELPAEVRNGQRITGMTSGQRSFPCAAPIFKFDQHGKCGAWVSDLLPYTAGVVDDIAIIKSLNTEAINHDPATTYIMTGSQQPGRPSLGAWLSYGLGSENQNLPAFVVLISHGSGNKVDHGADFSRALWGRRGSCPANTRACACAAGPIRCSISTIRPASMPNRALARTMIDGMDELNQMAAKAFGDPEINTRIAHYEMAFRMQSSVPELTDL